MLYFHVWLLYPCGVQWLLRRRAAANLGSEKMVCSMVEQYSNDILVAFLAGNMKRSVQVFRSGIRGRAMLKQ